MCQLIVLKSISKYTVVIQYIIIRINTTQSTGDKKLAPLVEEDWCYNMLIQMASFQHSGPHLFQSWQYFSSICPFSKFIIYKTGNICLLKFYPDAFMCLSFFPVFPSIQAWWATTRATCAQCVGEPWVLLAHLDGIFSSTLRTASPTAPSVVHTSQIPTTLTGSALLLLWFCFTFLSRGSRCLVHWAQWGLPLK